MFTIFRNLLIIVLAYCILSCSAGGGLISSNDTPKENPSIIIDGANFIPSIDGESTVSHLFVHNLTNQNINNLKFTLMPVDSKVIESLDVSNCNILAPQGVCVLNITAKTSIDKPTNINIVMQKNNVVIDNKSIIVKYVNKIDDADLSHGLQVDLVTENTLIKNNKYLTVILALSNESAVNIKNLTLNINDTNIAKISNVYCPSSNLGYASTCSIELELAQLSLYEKLKYLLQDSIVELTPEIVKADGTMISANPVQLSLFNTHEASISVPDTIVSQTVGETIQLPVINVDAYVVNNLSLNLNTSDLEEESSLSTCKKSLNQYSACYFVIKPKLNIKKSDTAHIKITYAKNFEAFDVKTTNLNYLADVNTPNITVDIDGGDSLVTTINNPINKLVTLRNTSDTTLNEINLTIIKTDALSVLDDNCSGHSLTGHTSCTFLLNYNPTKSHDLESSIISINGTYDITSGKNIYTTNHSISLQALPATAKLIVTPVTDNNFIIHANNYEEKSLDFILRNTGNNTATNINFDNMKLPINFTLSKGTCANSLLVNESCTFTLKFGPIKLPIDKTIFAPEINYIDDGQSNVVKTNFQIIYQGLTNSSADIKITAINILGDVISGDGESQSILVHQNKSLKLELIYTNVATESTAIAHNFVVDSKHFGKYVIDSNDCNQTTLANNVSCIIKLTADTSSVGVNNLILPNVTYTDLDHPQGITNVILSPQGNSMLKVNIGLPANITLSTSGIIGLTKTFKVNVNVTNKIQKNILINFTLPQGFVNNNKQVASCSINEDSSSCQIDVTVLPDVESGSYNIIAQSNIDGDNLNTSCEIKISPMWHIDKSLVATNFTFEESAAYTTLGADDGSIDVAYITNINPNSKQVVIANINKETNVLYTYKLDEQFQFVQSIQMQQVDGKLILAFIASSNLFAGNSEMIILTQNAQNIWENKVIPYIGISVMYRNVQMLHLEDSVFIAFALWSSDQSLNMKPNYYLYKYSFNDMKLIDITNNYLDSLPRNYFPMLITPFQFKGQIFFGGLSDINNFVATQFENNAIWDNLININNVQWQDNIYSNVITTKHATYVTFFLNIDADTSYVMGIGALNSASNNIDLLGNSINFKTNIMQGFSGISSVLIVNPITQNTNIIVADDTTIKNYQYNYNMRDWVLQSVFSDESFDNSMTGNINAFFDNTGLLNIVYKNNANIKTAVYY